MNINYADKSQTIPYDPLLWNAQDANEVKLAVNSKADKESPTFTGTPASTTPATSDNSTRVATTAFVKAVLNALIDTAPGALDTLNELATALGNDPNFATTITNLIAAKAPLASPTFTGTPSSTTPAGGDNSTRIATTAFVAAAISQIINSSPATLDTLNELAAALGNDPNFATTITNLIGLKAPIASPALTGTPTAPTQLTADNSTRIATTEFVKAVVAAIPPPPSPVDIVENGNMGAATSNAVYDAITQAFADILDSAPGALDTLNELAAALGDDPNFATTITNALALKAPLASPTFTGTPSAPTPALGDNSTRIATSAFVVSAIAASSNDAITPTGAVGNGIANDSAAITAWLNAGSNLYLPAGTYNMVTQAYLSATRDKVRIRAHPNAILKFDDNYAAGGGGLIYIDDVANVDIEGLKVIGNAPTTTTTNPFSNNACSIWVLNAEYVRVANCHFTQQPKAALRTDDCGTVIYIQNYADTHNYSCDIVNATSVLAADNISTGNGLSIFLSLTTGGAPLTDEYSRVNIYFKNCQKVIARNNRLYDNLGTPMKSDGCLDVLFDGNLVDGFGKDGLKIQNLPTVVDTIKRSIMTNNTVRNRRHYMYDGSCYLQTSNSEDYIIQGNILEGDGMSSYPGAEYGIYLLSTAVGFTQKRGIVANNTIRNMGSYGICTSPRVGNTLICNNIITDFSTILSNGHGIFIDTASNGLSIINNTITNTVIPSGTSRNGIQINGGDVRISGNTISNIGGKGIQYRPSVSKFAIITNNVIESTNGNAMYIVYVNGDIGVVTIDNLKVNDNTFARNCLTSSNSAVELYTGNLADDLDILLFQFANNSVSKGGTSATAYGILMWNDGHGSVARFSYKDNIYDAAIDANAYYGFTPGTIL